MHQQTTAATLPLLNGAGDGSIVHFAMVYRRGREGDANMESLCDDLAAGSFGRQRETCVERTECAPDQTQFLSHSDRCDSSPYAFDATKRPSLRLHASASNVSPFLTAWTTATAHRQREMTDHNENDALYHKVQQVSWEDDIQWGFEFASDATHSAFENLVVEFDDDDAEPHCAGTRLCPQPCTSASAAPSPAISTHKTNSAAIERPWMPSSTVEQPFDMTRPRLYRWELDAHPVSGKQKHQPLQLKAQNTRCLNADAKHVYPARNELVCPLNKELASGSWIDAIGWNSTLEMPESRLVLDENDAKLVFSVPGLEDVRATLHIPQRKISSVELERRKKLKRNKEQRITRDTFTLDFGSDTAEVERTKPTHRRMIRNIVHAHHSLPALKLSLTKPELSISKLRAFHRPRGEFKINERLRLHAPPNEPLLNQAAPQIAKCSDLNPAAGGKLILVEYTEQNPPMLSNTGMASQMLHYYRAPVQTSGVSDQEKAPDMPMGQVITLGDADKTPFVGDVPPGRIVTSLNSELFKVPIFSHVPAIPFTTSSNGRGSNTRELFLLCRPISKRKLDSEKAGGAYLLELPHVFTAGQVEPQMEVPAPNSRNAIDFIRPYMIFHIQRLFKKANIHGGRLKIEDVTRAFPNQSNTAIRKRMKEVATFERGGSDSGWWKKKPVSQVSSQNKIRANLSPEAVCVYESMMAGQQKLRDIGLSKLTYQANEVDNAISLLLKRLEFRKRDLSASLIDPRGLDHRAKAKAQRKLWKNDPLVRKLETDIQVARYIHEQLQLTPWNLTNNYVECHLQQRGSGMLQLSGMGDPSGRGEGFSFVRAPQSRATMKANCDQGLPTEANLKAGTTADLRKLKMKEAGNVLRSLGVPDVKIQQLKRWDRIEWIRDLSSLANARGLAGGLKKFVRGDHKSLSAQQRAYRARCNRIYQQQMDVLSSTRTRFSLDEEESDADEAMDEWGDDLEADILRGNAMGKIDTCGPKDLFAKGSFGLYRSKEALAEREEAAELRRLVEEMKEDDDRSRIVHRPGADADRLRNQLRASSIVGFDEGRARIDESRDSSALATLTDPLSCPSSPPQSKCVSGRKVLKRTTRIIEEDGSERVRIEFIIDGQQVARFKAMEKQKENQRKTGECRQTQKRRGEADDSSMTKAKKRKMLQQELSQLHTTEKKNQEYQAMLEQQGERGLAFVADGLRCTQCGQAGHMRTNRSCPLYMR